MGYIDDAFANLRHNLEITQTEQDTAVRRHNAIRDYLKARWDIEDDFLTGLVFRTYAVAAAQARV
jgi:hypothetical protein